jgi:hypothetical protein|tara:strand:+ start:362 stop:1048 length:687 start_codon:yes stop_codon:yes gene_type:complete
MRRVCSDENTGSAGISAMIVFVALVLVAAVVSIVMIKFGQVIFNDTGQDASDTESIMYGKIIIINGILTGIEFDDNDDDGDCPDPTDDTDLDCNEPVHATLQIMFELSPGAPNIDDDEIKWAVLCENENDARNARWSNEGNLEAVTTATDSGSDPGAVDEIEVGITYVITLSLYHTTDTNNDNILDQGGCPPNFLETHTLIFAMGNSGSYTSWELRYDGDLKEGEKII